MFNRSHLRDLLLHNLMHCDDLVRSLCKKPYQLILVAELRKQLFGPNGQHRLLNTLISAILKGKKQSFEHVSWGGVLGKRGYVFYFS